MLLYVTHATNGKYHFYTENNVISRILYTLFKLKFFIINNFKLLIFFKIKLINLRSNLDKELSFV